MKTAVSIPDHVFEQAERLACSGWLLAGLALLALACTSHAPAGPTPDTPSPPPVASPDPVRLLEALTTRQVFPTDNWWNQDVSEAPID